MLLVKGVSITNSARCPVNLADASHHPHNTSDELTGQPGRQQIAGLVLKILQFAAITKTQLLGRRKCYGLLGTHLSKPAGVYWNSS